MYIGYARVSSADQNTDLQLDALKLAGCDQVYIEKVSGAASKPRPEWDICRRSLRSDDTLVVWRLDRLGRSLKELVQIIHDLNARRIAFRSLTESIDTTSAGGKLIFHIFGALAEFEHALIRERTHAGLAAARARGRFGGRKPKLSNADIKKASAMLLDPEITKVAVAAHFKISRVTLNKALSQENCRSSAIVQ